MKKKLNNVMCKVLAGAMAVSMMPAVAMADDEVTLTYCTWNENQRDSIQATIDGFEAENPNIKVELQITPWGEYWTKLEAAATSRKYAGHRDNAYKPDRALRKRRSNGFHGRPCGL